MVSSIDENMSNISKEIKLTERDIPGTEVPKPAEHCTVGILKRWLSCRGAKLSGNRNELMKRFVNFDHVFFTCGLGKTLFSKFKHLLMLSE